MGGVTDWVAPQFARAGERSYGSRDLRRGSSNTRLSHIRPRAPAPVSRSFRAHPSALYEIRQFVRGLSEGERLSPQMTGDLLVAVSEACANSILHTNTPAIRVTWQSRDQCVEVEITDDGVFKRRVRMPELEGSGGHGISLMMALVDEFSIREGTPSSPGTVVRLVKCRID